MGFIQEIRRLRRYYNYRGHFPLPPMSPVCLMGTGTVHAVPFLCPQTQSALKRSVSEWSTVTAIRRYTAQRLFGKFIAKPQPNELRYLLFHTICAGAC